MFFTVRSGSLMLKLCLNPVSSVPFVLVRRSLVLRLPIVLLGPCDRTKQETGGIRYFPVRFESFSTIQLKASAAVLHST